MFWEFFYRIQSSAKYKGLHLLVVKLPYSRIQFILLKGSYLRSFHCPICVFFAALRPMTSSIKSLNLKMDLSMSKTMTCSSPSQLPQSFMSYNQSSANSMFSSSSSPAHSAAVLSDRSEPVNISAQLLEKSPCNVLVSSTVRCSVSKQSLCCVMCPG